MSELKKLKDLGIRLTKSGHRVRFWLMQCGCGNKFEATMGSIKTQNTKSCGCGFYKIQPLDSYTVYLTLKSMKSRCYYLKNENYHLYGGRCIKICREWLDDSRLFIKWANNNGYKKGLYIDRKDPNKNYTPENCRFVDPVTSAQNTRLLSTSNSSGYRGVSKHTRLNGSIVWRTRISVNKNKISLGVYSTKMKAAIAFDKYVKLNKTNHPLNF